MQTKEVIERIGKDKIVRWILLFSIMLSIVGIFQFFYIWFFRFQLEGYLKFCASYNFIDFFVQFIQVYGVLFIPLLSFIGFKYRNSKKFNDKWIKLAVIILLCEVFSYLIYKYHAYAVWEWVFLFIPIFILISSKFNLIFAFSFSYLSFYSANMLFEFQGLNFLKSYGTFLSYIVVFGIFIFTLYNLKLNIRKNILFIYLSFIPIIYLWVYFFDIWQLKGKEFYLSYQPYDLYVRLFTFPFYLTITIIIYFTYRKHNKP